MLTSSATCIGDSGLAIRVVALITGAGGSGQSSHRRGGRGAKGIRSPPGCHGQLPLELDRRVSSDTSVSRLTSFASAAPFGAAACAYTIHAPHMDRRNPTPHPHPPVS